MSIAEKIKLSEQEYLTGEETAEFKHEYINGEVWGLWLVLATIMSPLQ